MIINQILLNQLELNNKFVIKELIDKEDIIKTARKIGTFDISILPFEDCCTVFTPRHPVTNPVLSNVEQEEAKLDIESLLNEAFLTRQNIEV